MHFVITSVSGDSADLFIEDKSALAQMSQQTHKHAHTDIHAHTVTLALICNASNMWSYWPALWEAKLHGTQKPARQPPYIYPISISPGSCASGPIGCPRCSPLPSPPRKHTHIYSKHTCTHINPAVIVGHNPSCLSGVCGARWRLCVRKR